MSSFHRDSWVEVDLDCIYNNVQSMKNFLPDGVNIIAVVKANAYGHGDAQVAKTALEAGATYLAVAFLDEALSLRKQGIKAPILVLGASRVKDINIALQENITLTVYRKDWLVEAIQQLNGKNPLKIHLKLDTGMGRLGFTSMREVDEVLQLVDGTTSFELEGVYTHFATADELDTTYFEQQYTTLTDMIDFIKEKTSIRMFHCGNSATALRFPEKVFNAVRFGIAMYGLTPSNEMIHLLPFELHEAFSLQSKLVHVKKLTVGQSVSYGATYTAEEEEWIGTVPIGYADGWLRKLHGAHVLVDGKRVPIVGRICMDQLMIRLPYELPVGTRVTLIGAQKEEKISSNDIARLLDTINYEIPCMISYRVPRIFRRNKSIMEVRNYLLDN